MSAESVGSCMSISLFCDFIIAHSRGKCNNRQVKVCIQFGIRQLQNCYNGDRRGNIALYGRITAKLHIASQSKSKIWCAAYPCARRITCGIHGRSELAPTNR